MGMLWKSKCTGQEHAFRDFPLKLKKKDKKAKHETKSPELFRLENTGPERAKPPERCLTEF